jgi:AcrR family transcriptional regulator
MPQLTQTTKVDLTRHRIIEAAEEIFALKGFRAMTLRDVTHTAKVNLAAVNYHFGSKAKLMNAVIQHRFVPINEERMRRLNQLTQKHHPAPIPVSDIFAALIEPLYEQAAQSSHSNQLIRVIARCLTEPADFMRTMCKEYFSELCSAFTSELKRSCSDLSEDELHHRFFFSVSTMLGSIIEQTRLEHISGKPHTNEHLNVIGQRLVRYVVAGFEQNN